MQVIKSLNINSKKYMIALLYNNITDKSFFNQLNNINNIYDKIEIDSWLNKVNIKKIIFANILYYNDKNKS